MSKAKSLCPRTLRAAVRSQKRRMLANAHFWGNDDWVHMDSFLARLLKQAERIERKAKASKGEKRCLK
jgi:hypothetical protein